MISEYSSVIGILKDVNLRQFELSTTADDSNKKAFDATSIILILKNVWDNKVTSFVLQKVSKDGFKMLLILRTSWVAFAVNV